MKQHSNRHAARTAGQKEKSRKNTQLPKTHITPGARVLAVVLLVALLALHKLGEIQPFVIGSSQLLVHQHFIRLHKTMAGVSEWVHCPFQSASQPLKLTHTRTHAHAHTRTHTHAHTLALCFQLVLGITWDTTHLHNVQELLLGVWVFVLVGMPDTHKPPVRLANYWRGR